MPLNIFPNTSATYGTESSPFSTAQFSTTTGNSATVLSPPGFYFVVTAAHNTVQFTPDMGATTTNIIGTSSTGMVWSDGLTVQIKNDATGTTSARYYSILGN